MSDRAAALLRHRASPFAGLLVLAVLVALYPATGPSAQYLSLATSALVFGLAATGLGVLWGQSGQVTIAHAAVFGVGAYVAAILSSKHDVGFLASLPLSVVGGALAAGLIALASLRTRGHYFVILTFAIGQVAVIAAKQLDSITGGAGGITVLASGQTVLGLDINDQDDFFVLTTVIVFLALLVVLAIMRSRWGVILRGIRENPSLAASLGSNVRVSQLLVFVVSGALAGLAGQLFVYNVKFIDPTLFSADQSIFFLLMVLLGGRRYLLGPLVGAVIYQFLPTVLSLQPLVSQMVFGALLILCTLLFPEGLLSMRTRDGRRPWHPLRRERSTPSTPAAAAPERSAVTTTSR